MIRYVNSLVFRSMAFFFIFLFLDPAPNTKNEGIGVMLFSVLVALLWTIADAAEIER